METCEDKNLIENISLPEKRISKPPKKLNISSTYGKNYNITTIPKKRCKRSKNKRVKYLKNKNNRGRGRPRNDEYEYEIEEFTSDKEIENPKKRKKYESKKDSIVKTNKSFDDNENKNIANIIFASHIIILKQNGNYNKDEFYVALLDSYEHNSSRNLINCGIKKDNILMIELDNYVYNSHINENFNSFHGSLEKYSEKDTPYSNKICFGWYFDTCATIKTQEKGILQTIEKLNLVSGSILGFTFCRRGVTIEEHYNKHEDFRDKVIKILANKGFGFDKIFSNDYSGNKIEYRTTGSPMDNFFFKVI